MHQLVNLLQRNWFPFWRLRHNARDWGRRDALQMQRIPLKPDDESVSWAEVLRNPVWQPEHMLRGELGYLDHDDTSI